MASSIRPQFFCSRPNGTLTPLVALDELPPYIVLRGVPRSLAPGDTVGMTSLGTVVPRGQVYVVDGLQHGAIGGSHGTNDREMAGFDPRAALQPVNQQNVGSTWVPNLPRGGGNHHAKNRRGPSKDRKFGGSDNDCDKSKKVYCSFWLRTGECDYTQQGCKFKHVMPQDIETLVSCGLRGFPRWFREQNNVSSPESRANSQAWRQNPTPRSITYPGRTELSVNTNVLQNRPVEGKSLSAGDSIAKDSLEKQVTSKRLDLVAFNPGPGPAGAAQRGQTSIQNSPTKDQIPYRGKADSERINGAEYLLKYGNLGAINADTSPIALPKQSLNPNQIQIPTQGQDQIQGQVQNQRRPKRSQRSRRLFETGADSPRGRTSAQRALPPLDTNVVKANNGTKLSSEPSTASTRTPSSGRKTPSLTGTSNHSSPVSGRTASRSRSPRASFSKPSVMLSSARTKAMINAGGSDTLKFLNTNLIAWKLIEESPECAIQE